MSLVNNNTHYNLLCDAVRRACEEGRLAEVQTLLISAQHLNINVHGTLNIPLIAAVQSNHLNVAQLLWEYGANLDVVLNFCKDEKISNPVVAWMESIIAMKEERQYLLGIIEPMVQCAVVTKIPFRL